MFVAVCTNLLQSILTVQRMVLHLCIEGAI